MGTNRLYTSLHVSNSWGHVWDLILFYVLQENQLVGLALLNIVCYHLRSLQVTVLLLGIHIVPLLVLHHTIAIRRGVKVLPFVTLQLDGHS